MVVVIHYSSGNKEPDVYFGISEKTESKILEGMKKNGYSIVRADPEEWPQQDIPEYAVHHWNVSKKPR